MAAGGYRVGAGRKKGAKDKKPRKGSKPKTDPATPTEKDKIREMLAFSIKAKAKMYQEYLVKVSHGESLSVTEKKMMDKLGTELAAEVTDETAKPIIKPEDLEADEYLRAVWNDPGIETSLRIRAAEIIVRSGPAMGKKDELNERARTAGAGRFGAGRAPLTLMK